MKLNIVVTSEVLHFRDMIATGCDDRCVRVFYLPTANNKLSQPLKTFQGHQGKVFNVRWSPLRDGILASGADDKCVPTCACKLYSLLLLCEKKILFAYF